jgi:hypothetical protein
MLHHQPWHDPISVSRQSATIFSAAQHVACKGVVRRRKNLYTPYTPVCMPIYETALTGCCSLGVSKGSSSREAVCTELQSPTPNSEVSRHGMGNHNITFNALPTRDDELRSFSLWLSFVACISGGAAPWFWCSPGQTCESYRRRGFLSICH